MRLLVKEAVSPLRGEFVVPNTKYHAHRGADPGVTRVRQQLYPRGSDAGHVRYMIQALRNLGITIGLSDFTATHSSFTAVHSPRAVRTSRLAVQTLLMRPSRV